MALWSENATVDNSLPALFKTRDVYLAVRESKKTPSHESLPDDKRNQYGLEVYRNKIIPISIKHIA